MRRAVVLLADLLVDDARQLRVCLRCAGERDLEIVALAGRRPAAALAAVRAGADVVLTTVEPRGDEWAELIAHVRQLGAEMVYARRTLHPRAAADAETTLIRTALQNSRGDVDLVATLLGVPAARVRQVLAASGRPRLAPVAGRVRPERHARRTA